MAHASAFASSAECLPSFEVNCTLILGIFTLQAFKDVMYTVLRCQGDAVLVSHLHFLLMNLN